MAQVSVHQVDVQRDVEAADLDQASEPKNKCLESEALAIACFMCVLVSIAFSVLVSMCFLGLCCKLCVLFFFVLALLLLLLLLVPCIVLNIHMTLL